MLLVGLKKKFNNNTRDLQRYTHIFEGDATGGWHYYPTRRSGSSISNKVVGSNGVYKADVQFNVNGQVVSKNNNTFFPDNWSENKVMENINRAFNNKGTKINGSVNSYRATVDNVEIEMYITDDKIISAFPARTVINGF